MLCSVIPYYPSSAFVDSDEAIVAVPASRPGRYYLDQVGLDAENAMSAAEKRGSSLSSLPLFTHMFELIQFSHRSSSPFSGDAFCGGKYKLGTCL